MVEIVAEDVGREQVRGKLEALEDAAKGGREGRGQGGLPDAGGACHEGMAPGEESGEEEIGSLLGAQDRVVERFAEGLEGVVRHGDEVLAKPEGENGKFPGGLEPRRGFTGNGALPGPVLGLFGPSMPVRVGLASLP